MGLPLGVLQQAAPEPVGAPVVDHRRRGDQARPQPGQGRDRLERRAGGVEALEGPVGQRGVGGRVVEGGPGGGRDPPRQRCRVEGRGRRQGQDRPVLHVEGHHRPARCGGARRARDAGVKQRRP